MGFVLEKLLAEKVLEQGGHYCRAVLDFNSATGEEFADPDVDGELVFVALQELIEEFGVEFLGGGFSFSYKSRAITFRCCGHKYFYSVLAHEIDNSLR